MFLQNQINGRVQQRVAGSNQRGGRLPVHAHTVLVKSDAFVGIEHGSAAANHPITKADVGRDKTNLETSRLTLEKLA